MITAYYGWELAPVVDSSAVWANGYVGVWHLNETASPLMESSGVSTPFVGTASHGNKVTFAATGVIGNAVDFAGNRESEWGTRLEAADNDSLDGLMDLTIECWTCQETFFDSNGPGILLKKNNSDNYSWYLEQEAGGPYRSIFHYAASLTDWGAHYSYSPQGPTSGEWMYHAFTRTTSEKQMLWYNDGVAGTPKADAADPQPVPSGTATLKLGGGGGSRVFPGSIDEVRISNVSRSADWVKASHDTVTESAFATYGAARENVNGGMSIIFR